MTGTRISLRDISKKHVLAVCLALFVGAFVVAPQIIFITREGSQYQGLYMTKSEAELHYLASMKEFYDEGRMGNPFLSEYKFYGPQFFSSGAEAILAFPGKLLGISVPSLNLVYKFLLPMLAFLLVYALVFRLTGASAYAISAALMAIMGLTWFAGGDIPHLLRGEFWFDQFIYNRPVNPQFSGPLFFLYLNVLLFVHEGRGLRWLLLLGALLALSFYTYFYSFTFFLALNAVFAVVWYLSGKKVLVHNLILVTLGAIFIGLPPLLAIYAAIHHPDYAQLITANDLHSGHIPEVSKNGLLVSLLFIAYLFCTKAHRVVGIVREHALFLAGLLVTAFLVINQQVITGVTLQSGHYHWGFNVPIFIIVLAFLAHAILDRPMPECPRLRAFLPLLPWCASIIFILTGLFIQYSSYHRWASQTREDQRYMPALTWLNGHTPKESVVMANETLSELIPVFTENNVMWENQHILCCYLLPSERAQFTPENLLRSNDFLVDIKKYRVDYVLWDRRANPEWAIDRFRLPELFSSGELTVYRL